jgi:hypothetical protein
MVALPASIALLNKCGAGSNRPQVCKEWIPPTGRPQAGSGPPSTGVDGRAARVSPCDSDESTFRLTRLYVGVAVFQLPLHGHGCAVFEWFDDDRVHQGVNDRKAEPAVLLGWLSFCQRP